MLRTILATKLYIPTPLPKGVLRPRLIERLNKALASGLTPRVILISAPAGFGKTSLVSEWIKDCTLRATGSKRSDHQQPLPSPNRAPPAGAPQEQVPEIKNSNFCWLSLDEGDSDPIRFLTYLVAALRTAAPKLGEEVLAVLQSPHPAPIEPILTTLLNEITTLPGQTVLVLDDYHRIDSKPVDQALNFLLEHLPPQMTLVITTREDPNLSLARYRARGQLTELRAADLRFTPTEAAEFLDQKMGLHLSSEDIAALENRIQGWIAGLQLAALALQGTISTQGQNEAASFIQSFTGTDHFVMDYLIEEVLQQQSEEVQTFLLRTSILDHLCGPLCDAVLHNSVTSGHETAGQTTLEYIERANLFIFPLDNERHWYRYHPLFADLLRQRLAQSQTPEAIAQYHINASEWFEKNGNAAEAFRHLIDAREYGRAAGLAEMSWQGRYESFQSAAWLGWVKQLPEEIVTSRPVLCTQIAWGLMNAHEVDASESRLRDAERCLEGSPDAMVSVNEEQFRTLPARIAFARAYNAQTRRDFLSAVKYAELTLKLTPEENQNLRAQTTAILGATYLINGDLDAACQSMNDWIVSSMKVGDIFSAIAYAMAEKADILTAQGYLREAMSTYQQALELASEDESGVQRVMAHHYLGMAMLYHEMGDGQATNQHLQKSLELGDLHSSVDWSYRRCVAQARLKESVGELDAAIDLLSEAKRFYVKTLIPHTRPIDAIKARIYLKQGLLSKAVKWVNEHALSVDNELSYLSEYEHISLARVLLVEYQRNREEHIFQGVLGLLERLFKAAQDRNRMGSVLEIMVIQALVYWAQGSKPRAFAALEGALTLAQPEGYVRIFVDEGDPMQTMLLDLNASHKKQGLGSDDERKEYVSKLLSAFAQPKNILQSGLIDPLSQRELEVLRLVAQGLSNQEISERLFIALSSVKGHNQMIFSKLQVQSRTKAVARAREWSLL